MTAPKAPPKAPPKTVPRGLNMEISLQRPTSPAAPPRTAAAASAKRPMTFWPVCPSCDRPSMRPMRANALGVLPRFSPRGKLSGLGARVPVVKLRCRCGCEASVKIEAVAIISVKFPGSVLVKKI